MIINNLDPDINDIIEQCNITTKEFGDVHVSTDVFYPISSVYSLINEQYVKTRQYTTDTYSDVTNQINKKANKYHMHHIDDIYGLGVNVTQINSQSNSFKYRKCNVDTGERISFGFTKDRFVPFFNTLPSLFNINSSEDTDRYIKLWVGGNGHHSNMKGTIDDSGGAPGGDINVCFQDAFYIVARVNYKGAYMVVPFEITDQISSGTAYINLNLFANAGSAVEQMCFGWSMFAISKNDISNIYNGSETLLQSDMVSTIIEPEYINYSSHISREIENDIPKNSYLFLCFTANPYFEYEYGDENDIMNIYSRNNTVTGIINDVSTIISDEDHIYRWFNGGTFLYFHDVSLKVQTILDKENPADQNKKEILLQDVILDLNDRLARLEAKGSIEAESLVQTIANLETNVQDLTNNIGTINETVTNVTHTVDSINENVENVNRNINTKNNLLDQIVKIEQQTSSITQPENSSSNKALLRSVEFKPSLFGIKDNDKIKNITLISKANNINGENNITSCNIEMTNRDNSVSARSNIIKFDSNVYLTFNFDPSVKIKNSNDFYSIKLFNQNNDFQRVRIAVYDLSDNSNPLSDDTYVTWLNGNQIVEQKNWVPYLSTDYYSIESQYFVDEELRTTVASLNANVNDITNNVNNITGDITSLNNAIDGFNSSIEEINDKQTLFNEMMLQTISTEYSAGNSDYATINTIVFKPSAFGMINGDKLKEFNISVNDLDNINNSNIKIKISKHLYNDTIVESKLAEYIPNTLVVFELLNLTELDNNESYDVKFYNSNNDQVNIKINVWDENEKYINNNLYLIGTDNTPNSDFTPLITTKYYSKPLFMNDVQSNIEENNNKPVSSGAVYNALTAITESSEKKSSYWSDVVEALENCSPSDFDMTNLTYNGDNEILTSLGTTDNHIMYKFDANDDQSARNIDWNILGYNATVPEYIKYKSVNGNKIYVKSTKNDLLADINIGDNVYTRTYNEITMDYSYTEAGTINSISGAFSYGNNNSYAVPMTIIVSGTTYNFCGYNMTLQTKYLVNDSCATNGKIISMPWCLNNFSSNNLSNVWSNSNIRSWLNNKDYSSNIKIFNGWTFDSNNEISSFMSRMTNDYGFIENVQNIVNKTYVHNDFRNNLTVDSNNCQHTVDKFWLLDNGQINGNYENHYSDNNYTTSKLSSIFNDDNSRRKYMIDVDGNEYGDNDFNSMYWLRSASNNSNNTVGIISFFDGSISESEVNNSGIYTTIAPACTIG